MKYDTRKAFPHPVLRKYSSDYVAGEFSVEPEILRTTGSTELEIRIRFNLTNEELNELIQNERAEYVLLVHSPITFLRTAVHSSNSEIKQEFRSGELAGRVSLAPYLAGRVSLAPYLVAKTLLHNFCCDTWHEEYLGTTFDIHSGSTLAVGEPHSVYIDMAEESSVASIFRLDADSSILEDGLWNCDYTSDEDQVTISLSESDYDKTNSVRINASSGDANESLLNGVYFPALVWLLQEMDHLTENGGTHEFSERRWFRSLEAKLEEMNCRKIGTGTERLQDAQKIFEHPFSRLPLDLDVNR